MKPGAEVPDHDHNFIVRRINWAMLSGLLAMMLQLVAVVWWAGQMDRRVAAIEATTEALKANGEVISRLDERMLSVRDSITQISRQLEAIEGRRNMAAR